MLPLPTIEKLTYLALTRYAGANNRAWPAYETLARDVSCSKRRVIQAVERLVACGLVGKRVRGNRSNIYLLYPPNHYCEKACPEQGAPDAPRLVHEAAEDPTGENFDENEEESGVHQMHPEGEQPSPPVCTPGNLRVNDVHLKSTNNKTTEHQQHQRHHKKAREKKNLYKEIREEDIEAVARSFRSKGVQVTEKLIKELLRQYNIQAIQASIACTDFTAARNPLAVIRWMLANGTYVMPVEKAPPPEAREQMPGPVDDDMVRQMIKQAKENLSRKVVALV